MFVCTSRSGEWRAIIQVLMSRCISFVDICALSRCLHASCCKNRVTHCVDAVESVAVDFFTSRVKSAFSRSSVECRSIACTARVSPSFAHCRPMINQTVAFIQNHRFLLTFNVHK